MENKEKISLIVFVASVLALLILGFILITNKGITGEVIREAAETENEAAGSYSDDVYNEPVKAIKYEYRGSSGGGGGSSGASSGVSESVAGASFNIYDIGELPEDYTIEINRKDLVRFSISGDSYSLKVEDFSDIQATMNVNGESSFTLGAGEEKKFNLNDNFIIKLDSINIFAQKIILRLNKL